MRNIWKWWLCQNSLEIFYFFYFFLFCITVSFAEDISGYWTVTREIGSLKTTVLDQEKVDSYIGKKLVIEEHKLYVGNRMVYFTSYSIPELNYPVIPTQDNIENYFDENYGGYLIWIDDPRLKYYLYTMKKIIFYYGTEELFTGLFELFTSLYFVSPDLLILYKGGVYFAVEKNQCLEWNECFIVTLIN